jgi:hypothetical protein
VKMSGDSNFAGCVQTYLRAIACDERNSCLRNSSLGVDVKARLQLCERKSRRYVFPDQGHWHRR